MEVVIVIIAALIVTVLLDAGYQIALCLLRWAPCVVLGLLAGWLAHGLGMKAFEAALAALTMVIAKRVLLPILLSDRRCQA